MERTKHTFHTRHDFTPQLGWAVFQLLAELTEGTTVIELEQASRTLASPLARRSDLRKLLRSMDELGLLGGSVNQVTLSPAGQALAASAGRYEPGFHSGVHCLYAWGWPWSGQTDLATPSWSYRQVCREIRLAGTMGIEPDAIVLKVATAAERFGAERVSFSRSSVSGVTAWLKAHCPPLVGQSGSRLHLLPQSRSGPTAVRFHAAALCSLRDGQADLEGEDAELLADALLLPPQEVRWMVQEALRGSNEFHLIGAGAKRIVYRGSTDPFLEWIVHERQKATQATDNTG